MSRGRRFSARFRATTSTASQTRYLSTPSGRRLRPVRITTCGRGGWGGMCGAGPRGSRSWTARATRRGCGMFSTSRTLARGAIRARCGSGRLTTATLERCSSGFSRASARRANGCPRSFRTPRVASRRCISPSTATTSALSLTARSWRAMMRTSCGRASSAPRAPAPPTPSFHAAATTRRRTTRPRTSASSTSGTRPRRPRRLAARSAR